MSLSAPFNGQFHRGLDQNPIGDSPYHEGFNYDDLPSGPVNNIITEGGDFIITETGDFVVTE